MSERGESFKDPEQQNHNIEEGEGQEGLELKEKRQKNRQMYMIAKTFERREDPSDRIKNWILSLGPYVLESGLVDQRNLEDSLRPLAVLQDEDEVVNRVYDILKPFYGLKKLPEVAALHSHHVAVNEVCNYEISEDTTKLELHLPSTGVEGEVMKLYLEGLGKIAEMIEGRPEITEIFVDSWVVDRIPKKFERWGFTIKEGEGMRLWSKTGTISREEFLKRYLSRE